MIPINSPIFSILVFQSIFACLPVYVLPAPAGISPPEGESGRNLETYPFRLITVAVPDMRTARQFANNLVSMKLAALVNILDGATSVYIWDGVVQELKEYILLIYTLSSKFPKIEEFVRKNHVHVEPGIVSFPIDSGSKSFLDWIRQATSEEHSPLITSMNPVQYDALRF